MRQLKQVNTIMGVFTYDRFIKFRKAYNKAVLDGKESFIFEEAKFLTSFAKYMVEFLTDQFKPSPVLGNTTNTL